MYRLARGWTPPREVECSAEMLVPIVGSLKSSGLRVLIDTEPPTPPSVMSAVMPL